MKTGLGITSYKNEDSKDQIPDHVILTVRQELPGAFKVVPAWGIYKGAKEPSAQVIYERELTAIDILKIKQFLKKYNQESALLYTYREGTPATPGIGSTGYTPAIEFSTSKDVIVTQKEILKFTNGKFGEYLTYLPAEQKAFILCVKDFGMDCQEFQKQALLVAHKFHGKLFKTKNRVITNE